MYYSLGQHAMSIVLHTRYKRANVRRRRGGGNIGIIIGVVIAVILVGSLVLYLWYRHRRPQRTQSSGTSPPTMLQENSPPTFIPAYIPPQDPNIMPTRGSSENQAPNSLTRSHHSVIEMDATNSISPVTATSAPDLGLVDNTRQSVTTSPDSPRPPPVPPKIAHSPKLGATELPNHTYSPPSAGLEASQRYELP